MGETQMRARWVMLYCPLAFCHTHFSAQWINLGAGAYDARLDISTYTSGINNRRIDIQCGFVNMNGAAPKNPWQEWNYFASEYIMSSILQ
jgi:hypothetical protein